MVSIVTSKPNHYEQLGLTPDAGEEEIKRAFALAMSSLRPRSVGDMVQIALAFETLRDPARRRAYDASIAPEPEPRADSEPEPEPTPEAMFPRHGWPFVASARIGSAELPAIDTLPGPAPKADPPAEPEQVPFLALHRDEPGTPEELVVAAAPEPEEQRLFEPKPGPLQPVEGETFLHFEHGALQWKRPALAVGALFVTVGLLGAGLGWYASRGIAPAQAEESVTFPIPKSEAPATETSPQPAAVEVKAKPEHRNRPADPPARTHRSAPVTEPVAAEEQRADDVPDIPSETVAALTSQAAVTTAMPLPDAVVARTIRKIGYACGEVASTSAVDGASGVFKVTCSSGESYKATPVRGRYHFRRWGGN